MPGVAKLPPDTVVVIPDTAPLEFLSPWRHNVTTAVLGTRASALGAPTDGTRTGFFTGTNGTGSGVGNEGGTFVDDVSTTGFEFRAFLEQGTHTYGYIDLPTHVRVTGTLMRLDSGTLSTLSTGAVEVAELQDMQYSLVDDVWDVYVHDAVAPDQITAPAWNSALGPMSTPPVLKCDYIHVSGSEASQIANNEHVRLMHMWRTIEDTVKLTTHAANADMDLTADHSQDKSHKINLSFLHPVSKLYITIERTDSLQNTGFVPGNTKKLARAHALKGEGIFYGDHENPPHTHVGFGLHTDTSTGGAGTDTDANEPDVHIKSIKLTLNGQNQMTSLPGGVLKLKDMKRLRKRTHTSKEEQFNIAVDSYAHENSDLAQFVQHQHGLTGEKNIFCIPFGMHPESQNPSGFVNFSRISHAQLELDLKPLYCDVNGTSGVDWTIKVDACYYNWLTIKEGRGLNAFQS